GRSEQAPLREPRLLYRWLCHADARQVSDLPERVFFPAVSDQPLQNSFLAKVDMIVRVMLTISKDNPCLFITAVAKNRLPVFRTEVIKSITVKAIDEARTSCGFLLFAYVIMPDHFHVVTDSPRKPSTVLQFIKGIVSRRVLGYLKGGHRPPDLEKLYSASQRLAAHQSGKVIR